ncbi:uncharacterized protein BCR38DRAFT_453499 [Pseudomassariella vexata]|uniref:DUF7707 domain-containing protein n=1 Tax=Pseudomassariella vexata TaxID=1141098 RepID=A0A1Y2D5K4_9PEZI|nr:uncharacterized protein BCR38DRAFT_453499 [Pseudomassariella vexata]ORY54563.1 hypothetical protein BCR38DRAFT_453499 [Pseudomassariella vexata]
MLSLKNIILVSATLVSAVHADYVIVPSSVSLSLRTSWCQSEISTCPLICKQSSPGTTLVNECDPATLTYGCLCGNNLQPNVSEYSLTLPYFVCQEWGQQCVKACGSDNTCSSSCIQDHPCGAQNPNKVNSTSTSATASSTGTSTATGSNVIYTGLDGEGSTATSTPGGNAAPNLAVGSLMGFVTLSAAFVAGFGCIL